MRELITIGQALKSAAEILKKSQIQTPELDARLLLEALANYSHAQLISHMNDALSEEACDAYFQQIEKRASGKPVHRILGKREFYGREFYLNDATLIPRPDTEILVEQVITELKMRSAPFHLLEIGTGSGAIAITLACEVSGLEIVATDISSQALQQAGENAILHDVSEKLSFVETSIFKGLEGRFDAIVSNPPYIPTSDIEMLEKEVREHDPKRALDGGEDGLDFYKDIMSGAQKFLKPDGFIAVEIGIGQSDAVCQLAQQSGFSVISRKKDLSGVYRIVTAQ